MLPIKFRTAFAACGKIFLVLLLSCSFAHAQIGKKKIRVERLADINTLIGNWQLETKMMPLNQKVSTESGTMTCTYLYDSTYIMCDVNLVNMQGRKRSYKQFITYEPDSARFEVLYLYSNTPLRIVEFGSFTNNGLSTSSSFINNSGKTELIKTNLKIENKNLMIFESSSNMTNWAIDYRCIFRRE